MTRMPAITSVATMCIIVLTGCLSPKSPGNNRQVDAEEAIPSTVANTVDRIVVGLSIDEKESILATADQNDMVLFHRSMGATIRHSLGLWFGSSIAQEFYEMGITHPDDMSGALLRLVWQQLHNQQLSMVNIVRRSQAGKREGLILENELCPNCSEILTLQAQFLLAYMNEPDIMPSEIREPDYPEVLRMFRWYACPNGHEYAWTSESGLRTPSRKEYISRERLLQRDKMENPWEALTSPSF